MSNDITALAATLKRAAQEELMCREASDTSDLWQDEAGPENILVLVEALEAEQQKSAKQGRHACDLFDEVVAQRQRIAELERANAAQDDHINQQQDRIDVLERRNAELGKYAGELESRTVTPDQLQESSYRAGLTAGWNLGLANNNKAFNKCLAAHSTAGALESRTVTVKLPEIERPIDGTGYAAAAGERRYKERVIDALRTAGVQAIEGEGK